MQYDLEGSCEAGAVQMRGDAPSFDFRVCVVARQSLEFGAENATRNSNAPASKGNPVTGMEMLSGRGPE